MTSSSSNQRGKYNKPLSRNFIDDDTFKSSPIDKTPSKFLLSPRESRKTFNDGKETTLIKDPVNVQNSGRVLSRYYLCSGAACIPAEWWKR